MDADRHQNSARRHLQQDHISFSKDSVTLASGFFYHILDQNNIDNWQLGRYPFVYYGNKERYKIVGDSLYLYSHPYKDWRSLKITCNGLGEIRLVGERRDWVLTRKKTETKAKKISAIAYIKIHVYEFSGVGNYGINYRVSYSKHDILIYQQLGDSDPDHVEKTFKLKRGTFAEICGGFDDLDVTKITNSYKSSHSDSEIIKLELGLEDGSIIKSRIEASEYTEELRLALIPVLYGYQRKMYPQLKPVD